MCFLCRFEYHIDSSTFSNTLGHHNPHLDEWPLNSSSVSNSRVKIGGYLLGTDVKKMFKTFTPFTSDTRPRIEGVRIYAGLYYHSANLWQPEVNHTLSIENNSKTSRLGITECNSATQGGQGTSSLWWEGKLEERWTYLIM